MAICIPTTFIWNYLHEIYMKLLMKLFLFGHGSKTICTIYCYNTLESYFCMYTIEEIFKLENFKNSILKDSFLKNTARISAEQWCYNFKSSEFILLWDQCIFIITNRNLHSYYINNIFFMSLPWTRIYSGFLILGQIKFTYFRKYLIINLFLWKGHMYL